MSGIDKIIIKNFKAFPEEETIELGGKHLLLYGENGSGKSSIYWSLYTLFQAKDKGRVLTEKYFQRSNNEHLLNVFTDNNDSHIKISLIDEPDVYYKLDINGVGVEGVTAKTDDVLTGLNSNSDFISHRLLISFYHFRNSHEINLWTVFERDILPFIKTNRNRGNKTLSQLYKEIVDSAPFRLLSSGKIENHKAKGEYYRKIDQFNQDLIWWITEINQDVNTFYQTHFQNPDEEKIEIELKYEPGNYLIFGPLQQIRKVGNTEYIHQSRDIRDLSTPFIGLALKAIKADGSELPITRPQSYLNEAKLTAIALSIRLSLLAEHIRIPYPGKILALDDLLISLDMSNRDRVIKVILNLFSENYKIYLFTHDKSFFNLCKQRIQQSGNSGEWIMKEVYSDNESSIRKPFIDNSKSSFEKAEFHLKQFDYPAAANYLRKGLENLFKSFLPDNMKYSFYNNEITPKSLAELLASYKVLLERYGQDINLVNDLFVYKDVLLNPLSHDNLNTPVFRNELDSIITLIPTLENMNCFVLKDVSVPNDNVIRLEDTDINTGELMVYRIELFEHLRKFKLLDGAWYMSRSKCKVLDVQKPNGTVTILNNEYNSLKECCDRLAQFLHKTYANDEEIISKLKFDIP